MNPDLKNLPPPPTGQTGISLDQFNHLPLPPKGQQGFTLEQIQSLQGKSPGFFSDLANKAAEQYKQSGAKAVSGLEEFQKFTEAKNLSEATSAIGKGVLETGSGFIQGIYAPITAIAEKLMPNIPINPNHPIIKGITDLIQAHPEATKYVGDTLNIIGGLVGLKGMTGLLNAPLESLPRAYKQAGVDIGETAKTKIFGTPEEQVAKLDSYTRELLTPVQTIGKTGSLTKSIKAGRVEEGGIISERTINPPESQIKIENVVKTVPDYSPKNTILENNNAIFKDIGTTAQKLRNDLANRDIVPIVTQDDWEGFVNKVKTSIAKNPVLVGDSGKSANLILDHFTSELPASGDITAENILDARQTTDKWIHSLKGDIVFDPKTENGLTVGLRAVRQGANNLLAEKAPTVAVKNLLFRQTALYDALEITASKAAKEAGSALGRFLQNHPLVGRALKVGVRSAIGAAAGEVVGGHTGAVIGGGIGAGTNLVP